ncbi:H2.0-like homeobox protein [Chelonia mydas]|uniref:H2.0-like homeobox protein n=1 Tax=Chelonia mydas TaxID=8469 RepID=M7B271_CHEMY|nr:H2.0-like homeobox protein [Chelonia mydas]
MLYMGLQLKSTWKLKLVQQPVWEMENLTMSSKDLKFGIDRILSAEFDPKVKESNTLRDLTSLLTTSRQTGVHLPTLQPSAGQFFASLDPINEASTILGPLNTNSRNSVQHQFQDTFPAESESSDPESLDMTPSDTERTEGAEPALHQTSVIKSSGGPDLPAAPPPPAGSESPEPPPAQLGGL